MPMYAVVETGGKQYRVVPGDLLSVERLQATEGSRVEFDRVLLVAQDGGEEPLVVGGPLIAGARVVCEVVAHGRDKKVLVYKKKRRKNYRRMAGHRQAFTRVKITEISVDRHGT